MKFQKLLRLLLRAEVHQSAPRTVAVGQQRGLTGKVLNNAKELGGDHVEAELAAEDCARAFLHLSDLRLHRPFLREHVLMASFLLSRFGLVRDKRNIIGMLDKFNVEDFAKLWMRKEGDTGGYRGGRRR